MENRRMLPEQISTLVSAKLGRCARCFRLSLVGAAAGWATVAAMSFARVETRLVLGFMLCAGALTVLWAAHIAAFTIRVVRNIGNIPKASGAGVPMVPTVKWLNVTTSRRQAVGILARSVAVGIVLSLPPTMRAFAAQNGKCAEANGPGWYDCITTSCTTTGLYCCPPGHPYLNLCDCLCYNESPDCSVGYVNCNY
jgi:hypothetical protein